MAHTAIDVVPEAFSDVVTDERRLRRFLDGLPGVDPVALEQRAAALATRSIKKQSKLQAIELAISMVDLTTLEGADTPGKVRNLVRKGLVPDPERPEAPRVAAICIYPDLVPVAVEALAGAERTGTKINIASVATAFPSGRAALPVKIADVRSAVQAGADEIDMVIDRGAFLAGQYGKVYDEIVAIKDALRQAGGPSDPRLKVILETGELATYDNVRKASWLALLAGADFIKTSTGKVSPAATLPVTHVMLQAVRDWKRATGEQRAVKPAGGIRTAKDALRYLVAVREVAGPEWLAPHWFRFGASSVLNDLIMQRRTQLEGHYWGGDYVSVD
ncbi:MAG: deoxyribose-phosphate aldolase [Microlunatus sp.]|nr:deoxyribose-phosphate aldolase [Microlunatus sp.]